MSKMAMRISIVSVEVDTASPESGHRVGTAPLETSQHMLPYSSGRH